MKTKYSYKQIWTISYPILISLIMEQMIGMTDTAFLGRVGEIELGASAIAGVYYLAIFMMAFGFSIGAQILIARRNGEGNYKEIGPIFYQGIYFLLAMAVILFTFSIVFSPYILKNIISSPHIYDAAESYIHWRVYGFFFSFVMVMFRAFFVGTTQTKTLTLNSIVMVLSNVVFNYILIFGKFGFPQLGIAGAAIGSSLAEMVSVIFFIIYTWKRIDCRKYALNILPKFQGKTLKRILNVSVWTMIQNFVSLSTWFMFFLFVEHLGERSLAIANIIRNVSGIPFMIAMAFASTCGSLVSNLIGAGEQDCVRGTIRQHIRIGYIFVLPILIFFCLFPDLILRIYTDMPDLRAASVPSLWVLCSAYLVLVPATKHSILRRWLARRGFALRAETLCQAAGRWYAVMNAQYTGAPSEPDGLYCLTGLTQGQPGCADYYASQNAKLKKYRLGLQDGAEKDAVGALIAELDRLAEG